MARRQPRGGQSILRWVVGDSAVADALRQTVKARTIKGHEPIVAMIKVDGRIRECHLLYAGSHDAARSALLVRALEGAAFLTASDATGSRDWETSLSSSWRTTGCDLPSMQRPPAARIHLSSKPLNLAKMVKDEADVPR